MLDPLLDCVLEWVGARGERTRIRAAVDEGLDHLGELLVRVRVAADEVLLGLKERVVVDLDGGVELGHDPRGVFVARGPERRVEGRPTDSRRGADGLLMTRSLTPRAFRQQRTPKPIGPTSTMRAVELDSMPGDGCRLDRRCDILADVVADDVDGVTMCDDVVGESAAPAGDADEAFLFAGVDATAQTACARAIPDVGAHSDDGTDLDIGNVRASGCDPAGELVTESMVPW
nr:hypothetical protein [Brevibacterium siliguriense]